MNLKVYPEAESDAYRAMMQYVADMEQKYGK